MSDHSPPPQRPGGPPRGAAREYLEQERRRSEAAAHSFKSGRPKEAATAQQKTGGILKSSFVASILIFMVIRGAIRLQLRGVTHSRVVWLVAVCFVALVFFGARWYLKTRKSESSAEPKKVDAAGDTPAGREARALRILESDFTLYGLFSWVGVSAALFLVRGVTVWGVVSLAAGCFVALACFGAHRRLSQNQAGPLSGSAQSAP